MRLLAGDVGVNTLRVEFVDAVESLAEGGDLLVREECVLQRVVPLFLGKRPEPVLVLVLGDASTVHQLIARRVHSIGEVMEDAAARQRGGGPVLGPT